MVDMGILNPEGQLDLIRRIPAVSWDVHTDSGTFEILPMSKSLLLKYAGLTDENKTEEGAWVISDPDVISGGVLDRILEIGATLTGSGNTQLPMAQSTSDHMAQKWYLNHALNKNKKIRLVKIDSDGNEVDTVVTGIKGITEHSQMKSRKKSQAA